MSERTGPRRRLRLHRRAGRTITASADAGTRRQAEPFNPVFALGKGIRCRAARARPARPAIAASCASC